MITLQTARNLEKFCLEQISEAMGPTSQYANMSQAVRCILADYHAKVDRRKAEALKYAGIADRRNHGRKYFVVNRAEKETISVKFSIVIALETDESVPCELCNTVIERGVAGSLQQWADRNGCRVVNVEAAAGDFVEAFGGGVE